MDRGQSRRASAIEALAGTVTGFVLSVWLQRLLFPSLGHDLSLIDNALVATAFTGLSLLRGFLLRRVFNWLEQQR
jgi:hypothetical protein